MSWNILNYINNPLENTTLIIYVNHLEAIPILFSIGFLKSFYYIMRYAASIKAKIDSWKKCYEANNV